MSVTSKVLLPSKVLPGIWFVSKSLSLYGVLELKRETLMGANKHTLNKEHDKFNGMFRCEHPLQWPTVTEPLYTPLSMCLSTSVIYTSVYPHLIPPLLLYQSRTNLSSATSCRLFTFKKEFIHFEKGILLNHFTFIFHYSHVSEVFRIISQMGHHNLSDHFLSVIPSSTNEIL